MIKTCHVTLWLIPHSPMLSFGGSVSYPLPQGVIKLYKYGERDTKIHTYTFSNMSYENGKTDNRHYKNLVSGVLLSVGAAEVTLFSQAL